MKRNVREEAGQLERSFADLGKMLEKLEAREERQIEEVRKSFDLERTSIISKRTDLASQLEKLRRDCRSKFHPREGTNGKCPECGLESQEPIDYSHDAHP